jgi:DNA-binding beta-propeller fold protein YncE
VDAFSIDAADNIYVVDDTNARVTKWAPGALTGVLVAGGHGSGSSLNQMAGPCGLYVEPDTSIIWIADTDNSRIVKWPCPSTAVLVAGSYGSKANQFKYPQGLFVDTSASNTLYVADTNNDRIQMWLSGATNGTTVAGITAVSGSGLNQFYSPTTLIVDNNGIMYVVDNGNSRIMQWIPGSTSGILIAGTTTRGTLPNQLCRPFGIRFDSSGALIVADSCNNRIQKFSVVCCKFER